MWQKENPRALLVGMQAGAVTVEKSMEFPPKIKNGTAFDSAIPLLEYIQRNPNTNLKEYTHPYVQEPRLRNSPSAHRQMSG